MLDGKTPDLTAGLTQATRKHLCLLLSGLRAGRESGTGAGANGVHVQGGDLLPGDSAAEGPGGGAGEEVQESCDPGHWRWCQ